MTVVIISETGGLKELLSQQQVAEGVTFISCTSPVESGLSLDDAVLIFDGSRIMSKFPGVNGGFGTILLTDREAECGRSVCQLQRPFRIATLFELIFRLHKTVNIIGIGSYGFDYLNQSLVDESGGEIELTEKEAELIKALADAYPNSLEKKELLNLVWGYGGNVDTHTLETHIYRLRKKTGGKNDLIETDKDGYKIYKTT